MNATLIGSAPRAGDKPLAGHPRKRTTAHHPPAARRGRERCCTARPRRAFRAELPCRGVLSVLGTCARGAAISRRGGDRVWHRGCRTKLPCAPARFAVELLNLSWELSAACPSLASQTLLKRCASCWTA